MTENSSNPDFVCILANGDFPKSDQALALLRDAAKLVCCDGAADKALAAGFTPDYVVGDLDSVSAETRTKLADRLVRVSEQESNDLTKAFRFCLSQGWRRLVILGASGGREDHLIGNVSRLADFAEEADEVRLVTDTGEFRAAVRPGLFPSFPGQQISIFSFDPNQEITSDGLRYPLDKLRLPRWHVATLNEALGDSFSLDFEPGNSPLILFFARER